MQKYYEINNNGKILRGVIHIPQVKAAKVPIVIMFPGFTADRMEFGSSLVELSRRLEKEGIASARFDYSGSGESDGDFIDTTVSGEVKDAKVILDFVKSLDFVDPNRIGVLGMSLGGVVASMLAGIRKDDIEALVLWAPAAFVREDVRRGMLNDTPFTEATLQKGYIDFRGIKVGKDFIIDARNLNIYDTAANFNKKVLLIHGTNDKQVPIQASEKYLNRYGKNANLIRINGAGHGFESVEYRDLLMNSTVKFFKANL